MYKRIIIYGTIAACLLIFAAGQMGYIGHESTEQTPDNTINGSIGLTTYADSNYISLVNAENQPISRENLRLTLNNNEIEIPQEFLNPSQTVVIFREIETGDVISLNRNINGEWETIITRTVGYENRTNSETDR